MKTTHRSYVEELGDSGLLCRFLVNADAHVRDRSAWCLGRSVDWKYTLFDHKVSVGGYCSRNAELWFDAFGELAGFAISDIMQVEERGVAHAAALCHENAEGLPVAAAAD